MKRLLILILLWAMASVAVARIARIKLWKSRTTEQPGSSMVLWIAIDGSAGGLGTYASPLDYATSLTFTNYYRARKDGCYTDGVCVTNAYAPPVSTNYPAANFPLFWYVEQIP